MEQIPDIQRDSLEQFESKLLNPTLQKVADKRRKDHFKRLIAGCIGVGDILEENEAVPFHACTLQKCWGGHPACLSSAAPLPSQEAVAACSQGLFCLFSLQVQPG